MQKNLLNPRCLSTFVRMSKPSEALDLLEVVVTECQGVEVVATDGNANKSSVPASSPPIPKRSECGGDGGPLITAGSLVTLDSGCSGDGRPWITAGSLLKLDSGYRDDGRPLITAGSLVTQDSA